MKVSYEFHCPGCGAVVGTIGFEGPPLEVARWVATRVEEVQRGEADRFSNCRNGCRGVVSLSLGPQGKLEEADRSEPIIDKMSVSPDGNTVTIEGAWLDRLQIPTSTKERNIATAHIDTFASLSHIASPKVFATVAAKLYERKTKKEK